MKTKYVLKVCIKGVDEEDLYFDIPIRKIQSQKESYCLTWEWFTQFLKTHLPQLENTIDHIEICIFDTSMNQFVKCTESGFFVRKKIAVDNEYKDAQFLMFDEEQIIKQIKVDFLIIPVQTESYLRTLKMRKDIVALDKEKQKQRLQIDKLQRQLDIMQEEVRKINEKQDIYKMQSSKVDDDIDVGILYSNPLVKKKANKFYTIPSIGYYKEIKDNVRTFKNSNLELRYYVNQATVQNLKYLISKNPKIIQIISHGEFDKDKSEYYLIFEKKDGLMEEVYQSYLKDLFKPSQSQLLILSSCHSGEIAQDLLNTSKISNAIAVSAVYKIEDQASQIFSQALFEKLIQKNSIKASFKEAQSQIRDLQGDKAFTCCCAHLHDTQCPFSETNEKINQEDVHRYHVFQCSCPKQKQGLHRMNCDIKEEFLDLMTENLAEEEMDNDIDELRMEKEIKLCCCEIYRYLTQGGEFTPIDHDESLKFQLYLKDQNDYLPFQDYERGNPVCQNPEMEIADITIIGQNTNLYTIVSYLNNPDPKKICIITGTQNIGKTELLKQSISYVIERNPQIQLFGFPVSEIPEYLISLKGIKYQNQLKNKLREQFRLPYCQINTLKDIIKTQKNDRSSIWAFDDCEDILQFDLYNFINFLQELVKCEQIPIIVSKVFPQVSQKSKMIQLSLEKIEVLELSRDDAFSLFINEVDAGIREKRQINYESFLRLVQWTRTPEQVKEAAQKLNKTTILFKDLCEEYQELEDEKERQKESDKRVVELIMERITANLEKACHRDSILNILNILSLFPLGITMEEAKHSYAFQQHLSDEFLSFEKIVGILSDFNERLITQNDELPEFYRINAQYYQSEDFSNALNGKDTVLFLFYFAMQHSIFQMKHLLCQQDIDYQERLFDYTVLSDSSFIALNNVKDEYFADMNIFLFKINKKYFTKIYSKNWSFILLEIERVFAVKTQQFLESLSENKLNNDPDNQNLLILKLQNFIDCLCQFCYLLANIHYFYTDSITQVIELTQSVLLKTSDTLITPAQEILDNDELNESLNLCLLTTLKLSFLQIDKQIQTEKHDNEGYDQIKDRHAQKVFKLRVLLDEIHEIYKRILELQLNSITQEKTLATEIHILNYLIDHLFLVLSPLTPDHSLSSASHINQIISLYSKIKELDKFLREINIYKDPFTKKNVLQIKLFVKKLNLISYAIQVQRFSYEQILYTKIQKMNMADLETIKEKIIQKNEREDIHSLHYIETADEVTYWLLIVSLWVEKNKSLNNEGLQVLKWNLKFKFLKRLSQEKILLFNLIQDEVSELKQLSSGSRYQTLQCYASQLQVSLFKNDTFQSLTEQITQSEMLYPIMEEYSFSYENLHFRDCWLKELFSQTRLYVEELKGSVDNKVVCHLLIESLSEQTFLETMKFDLLLRDKLAHDYDQVTRLTLANFETVLDGCVLCCLAFNHADAQKCILQDYQVNWDYYFDKLCEVLEANSARLGQIDILLIAAPNATQKYFALKKLLDKINHHRSKLLKSSAESTVNLDKENLNLKKYKSECQVGISSSKKLQNMSFLNQNPPNPAVVSQCEGVTEKVYSFFLNCQQPEADLALNHKLEIRHLIAFEFHASADEKIQAQVMNQYVLHFAHLFIQMDKSIVHSHESAKQLTIQQVVALFPDRFHSTTPEDHEKEFQLLVGEGPLLFPIGVDHNDTLSRLIQ